MRAFLMIGLLLATGPASAGMRLGVNTHFDQRWPIDALKQVGEAQAQGIRDTVSWGKVEQSPGRYLFTAANSDYVAAACVRGLPVLLTITPRNKIYDEGETIFSPEARQAFAAFAVALADRYPCVAAFELGNEINGHALKGRMLADMPQSYLAIVEAVRAAVKPRHPRIALLSGSSLSVATGFFAKLIDAGLLRHVDGVVVHPYLNTPEQLPAQLARLRNLMERAGSVRPIWASEFGFTYETPDAAPPHAIKMITMLSAAGVERADWYALRDERWYPNMGLFAANGTTKPALDSFRLAVMRLLSAGDARRVDAGDPITFIYRFGSGPYVVWGGDRSIAFKGTAQAWDARGQPVTPPQRLGESPVIVDAPGGFTLGPQRAYDDSLTNFAGTSWSYFVLRPNGSYQPLGWIDWNWTPYIGSTVFKNFRVMGGGVTTAKASADPLRLVERYTSPETRSVAVSACFESPAGKPQVVTMTAGARRIWSATVDGVLKVPPVPVALERGESIDITYEAVAPGGPQMLRRRIRIQAGGVTDIAPCAPKGKMTEAGQ